MEKHGTTIRQLVAAIDDAHTKHDAKVEAKRYGGVSAQDVVGVIKRVLGGKAYVPPNPGQAYWAYISKRCQFLGVSLKDIEQAAEWVKQGSKAVRLPCQVEWFIRKLDAVLEEMAAETEVDVATVNSDGDTEWQINIGR
jgi:hypothetical protein